MIRYQDLSLALSPDGKLIEIFASPFGQGLVAPFVPPCGPEEIPALLHRIDAALRVLRRSQEPPSLQEGLESVGKKLYESLFPGEIGRLLTKCLTQVEAGDGRTGLRIRLLLRFPPTLQYLQALPWEIVNPTGESKKFFARNPGTAIVRTPNATGFAVHTESVEPPLKVLLLLSRPHDVEVLQVDAERDRIAESFTKAASLFGVQAPALRVVEAPLTTDAFRAELRSGFHVVHFAGHGDFDAAGQGTLQFENSSGRARSIDGPALAESLKLCPDLRLVVLNACWSALPGARGDGEPDLGVGTALAAEGIPAVVAMQQPIQDLAAIDLAGTLYAQLALGDPLELALCHARIQLAEKYPESPSWAIPVLLLGSQHGEIVRPPGRPGPGPSALASHIRNVSALIYEKTRDFVGRRFLFDSVEQRLQKHDCLLVTAEPGFGKTSFLAELVRRQRHIHHFNRLASADSNQKEHFLANVCAQLIQRYQLPYPVLPVEAQRSNAFLLSLCEEIGSRLPAGQKLLLVVDALDEVDRQGGSELLNPLDLPQEMPPGSALLLTGRPESISHFSYSGSLDSLPLDSKSLENFTDLREFARRAQGRGEIPDYCRRRGLMPDELVDELCERSDGNFMYLRYVLDDIEKGRIRDDDFSELPKGLENYYRMHWKRLAHPSGAQFLDIVVPTLAALTAIRRPVTLGFIAALLDQTRERQRIASTLRQLRPFLRVEKSLGEKPESLYQLYHGSFHDFVREQPEVQAQNIEERLRRFLDP